MAKRRGRGRVGGRVGGGGGRGRGGRSVGRAGAAANAAASAEYNPEIDDLRGQVKGSRKREADLKAWYAQLAADYRGAQDSGMAALRSVQDATSRQLAEAASRSSADLSKLAGDDAALAKLVGGPQDAEGLSKIAQAGAAAERSRIALSAPVAQEQANFVARLGGDQAAARMQGIEERRAEQRRRDKIKADLTSARKEKGAARATRKEEIREADRGYALDRRQLGLSEREAAAAERQAEADAAMAQVEAAREARQDAISNRMEQERIGISRRNAATAARSKRGLSPAERRDRREHSGDAMAAAKALLGIKVPKSPKEWAKFEAALIEKLGSSYSAEATAAVSRLRKRQAAKRREGYAGRKAVETVKGFG